MMGYATYVKATNTVEADKYMVERIKTINLGAGLDFDKSLFGENADEIWTNIMKNILGFAKITGGLTSTNEN